MSVELYADGLIIRWLALSDGGPDRRLCARIAALLRPGEGDEKEPWDVNGTFFGTSGGVEIEVRDDVGTEYAADGGNWYGDDGVLRGDIPLVPGVPRHASALTITGPGVDVRVSLDHEPRA